MLLLFCFEKSLLCVTPHGKEKIKEACTWIPPDSTQKCLFSLYLAVHPYYVTGMNPESFKQISNMGVIMGTPKTATLSNLMNMLRLKHV